MRRHCGEFAVHRRFIVVPSRGHFALEVVDACVECILCVGDECRERGFLRSECRRQVIDALAECYVGGFEFRFEVVTKRFECRDLAFSRVDAGLQSFHIGCGRRLAVFQILQFPFGQSFPRLQINDGLFCRGQTTIECRDFQFDIVDACVDSRNLVVHLLEIELNRSFECG